MSLFKWLGLGDGTNTNKFNINKAVDSQGMDFDFYKSLGLNKKDFMDSIDYEKSNMTNPNANSGGLFSSLYNEKDGLNFDALGQIASFAGDLMGAFTGWKQLGLAKDAFLHQKGVDQANIANQIAALSSQMKDTNANRAYTAQIEGKDPNLLSADFTTLGGGKVSV